MGIILFNIILATAISAEPEPTEKLDLASLDAPLLFVKRHPYFAGHIYDDYYTWHPGGGIHIIENPTAPPAKRKIRPVIDPTTPETLGEGVYRDPEISWDAKRLLFAFKPSQHAGTSIYEINIDGTGLRRITDPVTACAANAPPVRAFGHGRHDITPAYLPDGRIVFTSTRPAGRVPCFNSEVDVLHVMNADGSDVHPISVNNVNEFDPSVLPDGRILYGRWEYVDKTALYMQSLWTVFPDGTNETALYANNLPKPTAVLDARPVPGSELVVAALTPHNGQAVGAIAMIDPRLGKNDLGAITNFTPEYPTEMDQGLKRGPSDPWPINSDLVLVANNGDDRKHGVIQLLHRDGRRVVVHSEPDISCYSPMLVKPRRVPTAIAPTTSKTKEPGRFLVRDVYQDLEGVERDTVKHIRVIEETTRVSGIPDGGRWWNQAFLVSWQGAYVVKNILGVIPVHADGSAHFEAPSGRALYFSALDAEGREIQRMRTFVQAAPGVTRSCIGCHESKMTAPRNVRRAVAQNLPPARPQAEPWGSGFIDYPTMIQPVLDRNCVRCHGGEKGIAAGIDLTGGWTWAFSISYETLLKNTLTGFLNCHNSSTRSGEILPPRTLGSGAAPLTDLLLSGHKDRIPNLTNEDIRLVMAWMDTNSNYYGTWNWSEEATCQAILDAGSELTQAMADAGCQRCHDKTIPNDAVNLRTPRLSRILRAPLTKPEKRGNNANKKAPDPETGYGLALCRDRKAPKPLYPLVTQKNQPPDVVNPAKAHRPDPSGEKVVSFNSTKDTHYRTMLRIIQDARRQALSKPRVDMPGANIVPGLCRQLSPLPLPHRTPPLSAEVEPDGAVLLSWPSSAQAIGLTFELHASDRPHFTPTAKTLLTRTTLFRYLDVETTPGPRHYALVAENDTARTNPAYALKVVVPSPPAPPALASLSATPRPGGVDLHWDIDDRLNLSYNVYRADQNDGPFKKLNLFPLKTNVYRATASNPAQKSRYTIRSVNRRGLESPAAPAVAAAPLPHRKAPVFIVSFLDAAQATLMDDRPLKGKIHGKARFVDSVLDLSKGGYITYPHQPQFDLQDRFTIELWVRFDDLGDMPVLASCGQYNKNGWFIQKFQNKFRWHVAGANIDGGKPETNKWTHLLATYEPGRAVLYQDGHQIATSPVPANIKPSPHPLTLGQYAPGPGPQYQLKGQLKSIRLYRRRVTPQEALHLFEKMKWHQDKNSTKKQ